MALSKPVTVTIQTLTTPASQCHWPVAYTHSEVGRDRGGRGWSSLAESASLASSPETQKQSGSQRDTKNKIRFKCNTQT